MKIAIQLLLSAEWFEDPFSNRIDTQGQLYKEKKETLLLTIESEPDTSVEGFQNINILQIQT